VGDETRGHVRDVERTHSRRKQPSGAGVDAERREPFAVAYVGEPAVHGEHEGGVAVVAPVPLALPEPLGRPHDLLARRGVVHDQLGDRLVTVDPRHVRAGVVGLQVLAAGHAVADLLHL
jgi:hypothetical protein